MQNYKFLNHIVLCNVFFAIVCIPTAGKLVDVAGVPLSISIYYFPFVYILADILTEVCGYAVARRVLWYCIFAQVAMTAIFQFAIFYPPSGGYEKQSIVRGCTFDGASSGPLWNTCDVCWRHRQQLRSGEDESVDKRSLYIGPFCVAEAMRAIGEYRCFLRIRPVGDHAEERFNDEHYRRKPCQG